MLSIHSLATFPFALLLVRSVSAALVARDLHIQNAFLQPDGVNRSAVTSDGGFPAPLLSANMGDQFLINVIDQLTDPTMNRATSIHWHGLFQAHTAEMDGPAFVTQCPIVPGHAFRYNFTTPGQSGTYWYHSHLSTQYCDGLRGPLVIYDPNDPLKDMYDIDDDSTVITLADWYHQVSPVLSKNGTATPTPDSTLINGHGRFNGSGPLSVVRAQVGKRHRLRIVSTSCDPSFDFSIDGHNMTVIEADGVETEPVTVDKLTIFAAQRYSVIVTMDKPVDNYWIRAKPSSAANTTTDGGMNSAILRYDGARNVEPNSTAQTNPVLLNESDLHPLINPGAPGKPFLGGADVVKTFNITHVGTRFQINGTSFVPPNVPVLLQILSGKRNANELMPPGSVYTLPPNKVIEVNLPGGGNHPFHLHGHNFDVIRVSTNSTPNFYNPVRRDTVSTGTGQGVTFRFVTDNPGPWFLHCHIDWHLEGGLAVVLAEDTESIPSSNPSTTDWSELCPLYYQLNPDANLTAAAIN